MFRLLRYFSIASFISIVIATALVWQVYCHVAYNQLFENGGKHNAALTRVFSNELWPRFGAFLESAAQFGDAELKQHPKTAELHAAIQQLGAGGTIVKLKIYALDGRTLYSSELAQIGQDHRPTTRFGAPVPERR